MSKGISVWAVMGPSMNASFNLRTEQGDSYSGPMDDTSFEILNTAADIPAVRPMYSTKDVQGQTPFTLYNMNFDDELSATTSMDYLDANWTGNQIEIEGAWSAETGLQMGLSYTYDEEGEIDGIEGTPYYPLNATCYELMPPIVVYDENGDEISSTPPTSNADLRDINILSGQALRIFT